MSAPMTTRTIDPHAPGIPFGRELVVELRKLVGTRGPWILLGVMGVIWLIVIAVVLGVPEHPMAFGSALNGFGITSRIFVGVLAILLVTSEWGQRAVLTTFTLEPRRERVLAAKLCATLLGALVVFALGVALAALVTAMRGGSFGGADEALRYYGIRALFDLLMAFAMAMAVLNTAGAVVAYLVLPEVVVPAILFFGSVAASDDYGRDSLFQSIGPWIYPQESMSVLQSANPGAQGWAQILVCAVIWIGLPGALGVYRVMTSEVK